MRAFEDVQALVAQDMAAVDALIRARLASDVVLINQISEHIIGGGGKRLRPMLHLLAARAAGHEGDSCIILAALIEFIHTSTLLHDDVVDESDLRRGRSTANAVWGNAASVLVGDFLYSRSFQMMVELDSMAIMTLLADTTNRIAEGEVLQLLNIGNADVGEQGYLDVIERKTAVLFAAATELGAILAGRPPTEQRALAEYGMCLGHAFQIADDMLDYTSDASTLGKNVGDDLAEGKATLPLIHAMANSPAPQRDLVRSAIRGGSIDALDDIIEIIVSSGALDYTRARAEDYAERAINALQVLEPSTARDALQVLAHHAVGRDA